MASNPPPSPTRIFVDTSVLFAASLSETGFARDLIAAGARFLATYDRNRKHLLTQAALIQDTFGVTVATPETVLAAIK